MTEPTETDKPTKALFDHCLNVYNAMDREAKDIEYSTGENEPPDTMRVWEGFTTQLFSQLGLSTPYYTSVMNMLQRMGSVSQLRRGGGNARSRWRLHNVPTEEAFGAAESLHSRPAGGKVAMLSQGQMSLNKRVLDLEEKVHTLLKHMGVE